MNAGNEAQNRIVAEQVAEAAVEIVLRKHPELKEAKIPAPLKWAGAIVAALFAAGVIGMASWLVTSVSEMQVTLARMDERLAGQATALDSRFEDLDARVDRLETYHNN